MWESPIKILQTQLVTELEGEVLKAVCKYGVDIDKDRLLELLQNDRNSYDLGYRDGKKEVCEKVIRILRDCDPQNMMSVEQRNVLGYAIDILLENM